MPQVRARAVAPDRLQQLMNDGMSALEARLYAGRGIASPAELEHELKRLLPFTSLKNVDAAAVRLAAAIAARERLLIVADYDADGATACSVGLKGLAMLGAVVDFVVPNRFEYGYGLTPEIVELAAQKSPDLIVTVDNGIASVAGVAAAKARGIDVLVTDHHLPGDTLPDCLIVNPNQPGCGFPSKNLAGVGVMFYVLLALRAELRARGAFADVAEPNLATLLDLVALGTVADVVRLDGNNRILVEQGLRRMRAGRASAGVMALFQAAGRNPAKASCFDLGFTLGPRLNAAGRLDDMSFGISCLLSTSEDDALTRARELDQLNRERRTIEAGMREEAETALAGLAIDASYSIALYRPDWHQGVIGIVASRVKERYHRPTIVFADASETEIKGSGRSIPGLHLRDALDLVSKRHPDLIVKFGGHAMAAGLSLRPNDFGRFQQAFEAVCRELMDETALERVIETDGELSANDFSFETAERIERQVWGQGFPAPLFHGHFRVLEQRVVGERHLKVKLANDYGLVLEGIRFQHPDPLPRDVNAAYSLSVNEFRGERILQVMLDYVEGSA
ncbi:single-stranded-DNA-specific exonuclease RecJ [Jeongeupia naejangsanensis]|uniref:Single-stranded-DNA-specific exonuclease RecJ n=2 Tax=Jeongeupia naejangsanensis TaxID=613195 RepID=A0ABS2BFX2_9NEIS|nr:single-stranded-DNA-specific exonuclease RecJ [Jeongeupia naejangsanensis]MBM3114506.1 single-stranded-DNA-specific exonuclease RecJ [Jeongeupia naejangsanensis]